MGYVIIDIYLVDTWGGGSREADLHALVCGVVYEVGVHALEPVVGSRRATPGGL